MRGFIHIAAVAVSFLSVLIATASTAYLQTCQRQHYKVLFGYKLVDYQFPSEEVRQQLINSGEFIPENSLFTGIKIFGDRIFLAVPRLRMGVPSTFNFIKLSDGGDGENGGALPAPPLIPYPSWEMQKIGNCSAIQFSQSMEIDEFGRLWIIDSGRVNVVAEDPAERLNLCPAKILIFDLATDELLLKYEFPPEVVSPTSTFLDDIAVACGGSKKPGQQHGNENDKFNCWAYLTDIGDSRLVVFNLKEQKSWSVRHNASMGGDPNAFLGNQVSIPQAINGIGISPKDSNHDRVYYAPFASYSTYSVSTFTLKNAKNGEDLEDSEITVNTKKRYSQSGGMIMDSEGTLFYWVMKNNSVACVDTQRFDGFEKETEVIRSDRDDLETPDSFTFDNQGYMYTNHLKYYEYFTNTLNVNEINFRVVRTWVGSRSYMYPSVMNIF